MADQRPQGWGPPQPPAQRPKRRPGAAGWIVIAVVGVLVPVRHHRQPHRRQPDQHRRAGDRRSRHHRGDHGHDRAGHHTRRVHHQPADHPAPTPTTQKPTPTTRQRPPTTRKPPQTTQAPARNCDPAYPDVCLHDGIGDYDCAGVSGNGPRLRRWPPPCPASRSLWSGRQRQRRRRLRKWLTGRPATPDSRAAAAGESTWKAGAGGGARTHLRYPSHQWRRQPPSPRTDLSGSPGTLFSRLGDGLLDRGLPG
jgi:hypothetical protein